MNAITDKIHGLMNGEKVDELDPALVTDIGKWESVVAAQQLKSEASHHHLKTLQAKLGEVALAAALDSSKEGNHAKLLDQITKLEAAITSTDAARNAASNHLGEARRAYAFGGEKQTRQILERLTARGQRYVERLADSYAVECDLWKKIIDTQDLIRRAWPDNHGLLPLGLGLSVNELHDWAGRERARIYPIDPLKAHGNPPLPGAVQNVFLGPPEKLTPMADECRRSGQRLLEIFDNGPSVPMSIAVSAAPVSPKTGAEAEPVQAEPTINARDVPIKRTVLLDDSLGRAKA